MSVLRRRCPRCGSRLKRVVALEESYTRKIPRGYMARGGRPPMDGLDTAVYRITPVYLVCPECGFRVRRRSLRTQVR